MHNYDKNKPLYKGKPAPLICWDIFVSHFETMMKQAEDKDYIQQFLSGKTCKLPTGIDNCLHNYDAIVITKPNQLIEWVSTGFFQMTGYQKSEVIDRKPSLLQNTNTHMEVKQKIRKFIEQKQPVQAQLINCRKSGEEYLCDVDIRPVFNRQEELSHFIAFEKEVYDLNN